MSSERNSQSDEKIGGDDESLEINHFCTRLESKIYVLLELKPFQIPARNAFCQREHLPRIPIRLVCVIDVSHSMAEPHGAHSNVPKLDKIKLFGHLLARSLGPDDHLGVVVFGTTAEVAFPLQKMTEEAKKRLVIAFKEITIKGVTNMSAGIFCAIDQFNQTFGKKSRCTNDNILLFSDGMSNEGIVCYEEIAKEINKRVNRVREDCHFEYDYFIRFTTIGASGFYPETLFNLGRQFGSGAFHHLGEDSDICSDLMLSFLTLQETVLTGVHLFVSTLNGVQFEAPPDVEIPKKSKDHHSTTSITSSYIDGQLSISAWEEFRLLRSLPTSRPPRTRSLTGSFNKVKLTPSRSNPLSIDTISESELSLPGEIEEVMVNSESKKEYFIHEIGIDTEKHVLLPLVLPKKHKKLLKGKDVLSIKIHYKDHKMTTREIEKTISYIDLPPKELQGEESEILTTYKTIWRIKACSAFDRAAGLVAKLDRHSAVTVLESAVEEVRADCEKILTAEACNEEENHTELYKAADPLLANLNRCRSYTGDYSVRWDDVWGRLMSLRSSLARELPVSPSVYADKVQLFMTEEIEAKLAAVSVMLDQLCIELNIARESSRDVRRISIANSQQSPIRENREQDKTMQQNHKTALELSPDRMVTQV